MYLSELSSEFTEKAKIAMQATGDRINQVRLKSNQKFEKINSFIKNELVTE